MKKLKKIRFALYFQWHKLKEWIAKTKRLIWNRGLLLWWYCLWVRKSEFHHSLSIDTDAMIGMSQKQRDDYLNELDRRRQIAHEGDP
ncbi:MAG: hypothetical protein WC460_02020 [Patescibacteria group bacterium]